MNKVILVGRLTKDTELLTAGENQYVRFNLAVGRRFKNANEEYEADFISCVAWNKTAELINKHFKKGSGIALSGRIQTGSYDADDGSKRYTTDVIVEEITFVESKKEGRPAPEYTGVVEETKETDPFSDFGKNVVNNPLELTDDDLPF